MSGDLCSFSNSIPAKWKPKSGISSTSPGSAGVGGLIYKEVRTVHILVRRSLDENDMMPVAVHVTFFSASSNAFAFAVRRSPFLQSYMKTMAQSSSLFLPVESASGFISAGASAHHDRATQTRQHNEEDNILGRPASSLLPLKMDVLCFLY